MDQKIFDTLPKKLQIGVYSFKLSTPAELRHNKDNRVVWGQTDKLRGEISVSRENWSPEMVVSTLLHECAHAGAFATAPVNIKSEEDFCEAFETVATLLFTQNPKLVDWIRESLHG